METRQKRITLLESTSKDKIRDFETKKIIQFVNCQMKNVSKNKIFNCWWCTLPIEGEIIGCPVNLKINKNENGEYIKQYATNGIFCSFNCIKAFIIEQSKFNTEYKNSIMLLANMVCDLSGELKPLTILPAPPKHFLIQYGGDMPIEQYKNITGKIEFIERGIIEMFPIKVSFEEMERSFQ